MEISDLSVKQRQLLRVISELGGFAHTKDLTGETELSNDLVGYHMRVLIRGGFVERAGTVDVGAPQEAKNYKLTEKGRGAVSELPEERPQEDLEIDPSTVAELERTVIKLERQNETLWGRVEDLEDEKADSKDLEKLVKRFEKLKKRLEKILA